MIIETVTAIYPSPKAVLQWHPLTSHATEFALLMLVLPPHSYYGAHLSFWYTLSNLPPPFIFTISLWYTMCDNGVRYIHTQQQAEAELERQRQMAKARRARQLERTAADHETAWIWKQNRIQNDLFHIENITDAHKMAKIRLAQKERHLERSAEERDNISRPPPASLHHWV